MKLIDYHIIVPTQNTTVSLFPFACVHQDNPGHSIGAWREYLEEVKNTPNGYAIGLGDYYDWLRTHARDYLKHYPNDENSFQELDKYRQKMAEQFAAQLQPIQSRLIGLSLGNHHHQFQDGHNDTMEICRLLKVPYLEKGFFVRLHISKPGRSAHAILLILGHHGDGVGGAGYTAGGDVNTLHRKSSDFQFDILLVAHNHRKWGDKHPLLTVPQRGSLRLIERQIAYVRCGCFMRGYVEGCTTYAESRLMKPTDIGHVRLDILFKSDYDAERHRQNKQHGKGSGHTGPLRWYFKVIY